MTAPVTATQSEDDYVVSFTMPSGSSMADLPRPNNPDVTLEAVGSRLVAVVRFSGYFNEKSFAHAESDLREWMRQQSLTPVGEPVSAQYDAPWKPGFARHNEVQIPAEDAAPDQE